MFSPAPSAPSPVPPRSGLRRGGPHLFKTVWPGVRASLLEGLLEGPADDRPLRYADQDGGRPPPWSRAA